eukprot:5331-Heterococcus_DN1.PRE.1
MQVLRAARCSLAIAIFNDSITGALCSGAAFQVNLRSGELAHRWCYYGQHHIVTTMHILVCHF